MSILSRRGSAVSKSLGRIAKLIGIFLVFSTGVCRADGNKPPSSGELFSYEGTLSLSGLSADSGVTTSIVDGKGSKMIKVDFSKMDGYPGISFPVPAGGWDLSGFTGTQIEVNNPGSDLVTVNMRVDNEGDWHASPWSTDVITLSPGRPRRSR